MAEAPAIGIDLGTTYRYTRSCSRSGQCFAQQPALRVEEMHHSQLHAKGRMRSCRLHEQLLG